MSFDQNLSSTRMGRLFVASLWLLPKMATQQDIIGGVILVLSCRKVFIFLFKPQAERGLDTIRPQKVVVMRCITLTSASVRETNKSTCNKNVLVRVHTHKYYIMNNDHIIIDHHLSIFSIISHKSLSSSASCSSFRLAYLKMDVNSH